MSGCSLTAPLKRDGTSQRQREPRALEPCAAPIDGRTTADVLLYTSELARLLRYYTETNVPKGDWRPFLEQDVSTIAARVGAYDAAASAAAFEPLHRAAVNAGIAAFPAAFAALFPPLYILAAMFDAWQHGSVPGLQLRARLDRIITGILADSLQSALRARGRAKTVGAAGISDPPALDTDVWGDLNPPDDLALFPSNTFNDSGERATAVKVVAQAFERFHEAARRLADEGPRLLADTLANHPQHQPHVALFLAFLRLFNHARAAMNGLTGEHLDFYYGEVLELVPRGPIADRVHVIFELAKNLPPARVPVDAALDAGKDGGGKPLLYGTDAELVVNRAAIDPVDGLKTVFVEFGTGASAGIPLNVYAAGDADNAAFATTVNGEVHWPPFGNTSLPFARLGFAIASPAFWLSEGTRNITLTFNLSGTDYFRNRLEDLIEREVIGNVTIEATGPKGWIPVKAHPHVQTASAFTYVLEIDAAQPAVVGFNAAIHKEAFDTTLPMLRILFNNDGMPGERLGVDGAQPAIVDYTDEAAPWLVGTFVRFEGHVYEPKQTITEAELRPTQHPELWRRWEYACPYKYFEAMHIRTITIDVDVRGMRNVILESDAGKLNPAKPFAPFGTLAREKNSFYIGSWEIFQKSVKTVTVSFDWVGLPNTNFHTYYAGYTDAPNGNGDFTVKIEALRGGKWDANPWADDVPLFGTATAPTLPSGTFSKQVAPPSAFGRTPTLGPIPQFKPGLDRGFLRLSLKKGFLHDGFAAANAVYAANLAAYIKGLPYPAGPPAPPNPPTPPNPPDTPMATNLTVNYTATETLPYSTWNLNQTTHRIERLYRIGPFGFQEFAPVPVIAAPKGVEPATSPVPAFPPANDDASSGSAEGTLYLGLSNLVPGENLSLLFQMAEGSEDPSLPAQPLQWSCLTPGGWRDFPLAEMPLDTTSGLIASGIVQFAIPDAATSKTTLLPSGLHWLRATVNRKSGAVPKAVAVLTQAVQASFRDRGNAPSHLQAPLPAGTIGKLVQRLAPIKSVSQPFSSFGGRAAEGGDAFRVRVAERLRHKQRAVTLFDYERLVLEQFPEVYKVRCLTHTSDGSEFAPGSVRIVVVPNLRNRNAVDPLRPRLALSRLEAIRRDLKPLATDFAEIAVVNPDYEEVRVSLNVRFMPGRDKGFYTGQLAQDIVRFLSPWLFDEGVDLSFGGRVHRSAILDFIEKREYVDFITDFTIDQIIPATTGSPGATLLDVEEAVPTRSSGVIVSSESHTIGDSIVSCLDATTATS